LIYRGQSVVIDAHRSSMGITN